MWDTAEGEYDIVDGTPFGRDILKELSEECARQGIALHLYYSPSDWVRDDYPQGRTGKTTGRDPGKADWNSYYGFMNRQLTELLTGYGPIRAIWFDGWWDHDEDKTPLTGTSTNSMSLFTGFNPPAWWPTTIIRIHSRARTYRFSNATCREKTRQDIHFRTSAGCRWKHATQ